MTQALLGPRAQASVSAAALRASALAQGPREAGETQRGLPGPGLGPKASLPPAAPVLWTWPPLLTFQLPPRPPASLVCVQCFPAGSAFRCLPSAPSMYADAGRFPAGRRVQAHSATGLHRFPFRAAGALAGAQGSREGPLPAWLLSGPGAGPEPPEKRSPRLLRSSGSASHSVPLSAANRPGKDT